MLILTILSVALTSTFKLWSYQGDGVVPPRHDKHADHFLDAIHYEVSSHFLQGRSGEK